MDAESPVTLRVTLLSGVTVVDNLQVSASTTIGEVKSLIQATEGTFRVRQQLVYDCAVLRDETKLQELGITKEATLGMVRRTSCHFFFDVASTPQASTHFMRSPQWQMDGVEGTLHVDYYHDGFDSSMHQPGNCSVMVHRPSSTLLYCRVRLGEHVRETITFGEVSWVNFAPAGKKLPEQIELEVLHLGAVQHPVIEDECCTWDLRKTLGGMPFVLGQQVCCRFAIEGVELQLAFFPGGTAVAPEFHSTLWVFPGLGVEDRRYVIVVDGHEQLGHGECRLHFPRPEYFGHVRIRFESESERAARLSRRKSLAAAVVKKEPEEAAAVALESPGATPAAPLDGVAGRGDGADSGEGDRQEREADVPATDGPAAGRRVLEEMLKGRVF